VRWALNGRPGIVIDPSFGGCAMLRVALDELRQLHAHDPASLIYGADIDSTTAQWAAHLISQGVPPEHLLDADFLSLSPGSDLPLAAAVVGNPPYVRHHWISASSKYYATAAANSADVHLSRRASLWAYFVIHSTQFVAPGGRLALLLPGAVLQADYAQPVLTKLQEIFEDVLLVRVRERIFDDAQEETVVLLASVASRKKQLGACRHAIVNDVSELEQLLKQEESKKTVPTTSQLPGVSDWKMEVIPSITLELLNELLANPRLRPISEVAKVALGTVTGANEVFVISTENARYFDILDYTRPVVSRSSWLAGTVLTTGRFERMSAGQRGRLLLLPPNFELDRRTKLGRHISDAEKAGVMNRHHCSRQPWWSLRAAPIPSAFLPYTVGEPRGLAMNRAHATSTNTVHQVTWLSKPQPSELRSWTLSTWSTVGRLCTELFGRHYGGGVLKLELSDARRLPIIDGLDISDAQWALASGNTANAKTAADTSLISSSLGIEPSDLVALQNSADLLRAHRLGILQSADTWRLGKSFKL